VLQFKVSFPVTSATPGGFYASKAQEAAGSSDVASFKVTGTVTDSDGNEYAYTFSEFSHEVEGEKFSNLRKIFGKYSFKGECTLTVELGTLPWGFAGGGGGGGAPAAAAPSAGAPAAASSAAPEKKEEKPKEEEVDVFEGGMDMFGGSGGGGGGGGY